MSRQLLSNSSTQCSRQRPQGDARRLSATLTAAVVSAAALFCTALAPAQAATLVDANFDSGAGDFFYTDDAFSTVKPSYASGAYVAAGGYGGTGGLQVALGGVDANVIAGMSGGWETQLNLAAAQPGVKLSFRYKLAQTATYEYDEYSRVLVTVDGVQYGRGAKDYVDHIGGDGSSTQGNSSTFLPTTDWQQVEIYLGDLSAGNHDLIIGGYNNKKDAADESTTVVIDNVLITSGHPAPATSDVQTLVDRLDSDAFLGHIQGVAEFHDRCRGSSMGCSSTDYTTNYMGALAWVEAQLQAMGYTTVRHAFTSNTGGTNLYATKVGSVTPTQMYMVSAHLDARSGGDGFDDDGSGVALVLEAARVFAGADVNTDKSVRFIFWDKEETGLNGSAAYASNTTSTGGRRALQGTLDEPTWLGLIQHDMVLYDHGAGTRTTAQSAYADLDVEWRAGTTKAADSQALALKWAFLNGEYATDYPATAYNYSTNTDDTPFQPYVASISVRENRRSLTSGTNAEWINPYYHTVNDVEGSYTRDDDVDGVPDDIELGFNAVQSTVGLVAELAGARIATSSNNPPVANAQSVNTAEDAAKAITLSGSDPDSDPLTFQVVSNPAHGALSGTAPNLTYTPAANYNGADSFSFRVNDGTLSSSPAAVSITVAAVNDAPVATGQTLTVPYNTPLAITLSGFDIDGDSLTYSVASGPANGALSGTAPKVTYTPVANYSGPDSFTFTVNDGTVSSSPATVSITVSPAGPATVFVDDFETNKGWTRNPNGTDTATLGLWERADPQSTSSSGTKQLGTTASGSYDLVTGPLAGSSAGNYDVDGGLTSIRSPNITLPAGQALTLSFKYYLAHGSNSSSADYLRVKVVGATTTTVLGELGANNNDDAVWASFSGSLATFAGQTVYLLVECADASGASLVECAIDDVKIVAQ